ncbi:MAG: peptidoglycan-binding protein LysM [Parvularculaceae bacterium]
MGLFSFIAEAGEKIAKAGANAADDIKDRVGGHKLDQHIKDFDIKETAPGKVILRGKAKTREAAEKLIVAAGNTAGVAEVESEIEIEDDAPEATMYTVKSGDSLSKIAKAHYGDAMKYTAIFAANQPMLSDPDKIYPGQVLRIPAKEALA